MRIGIEIPSDVASALGRLANLRLGKESRQAALNAVRAAERRDGRTYAGAYNRAH